MVQTRSTTKYLRILRLEWGRNFESRGIQNQATLTSHTLVCMARWASEGDEFIEALNRQSPTSTSSSNHTSFPYNIKMPATTAETLSFVSRNVSVAPLVLLSAADHYGRSAKGTRKRVVGVLLGQNDGKNVRVSNSFAGMNAQQLHMLGFSLLTYASFSTIWGRW